MGNEDETEKYLNKFSKSAKQQLCLKPYTTKDAKGKKVTRRCIKKKGHWFGHK